jgi:hypothetical protein
MLPRQNFGVKTPIALGRVGFIVHGAANRGVLSSGEGNALGRKGAIERGEEECRVGHCGSLKCCCKCKARVECGTVW